MIPYIFIWCTSHSWAFSRNIWFIRMNYSDVLFCILYAIEQIFNFRQEILILILILPLQISRPHFFIYKMKESTWILLENWPSSKIWFYSERFERKNISIINYPLQNQSLINLPFQVNTLCPRSINIIIL